MTAPIPVPTKHLIDIRHVVNNILRRICIEHSVQVAVGTELLPHSEPGVAFGRGEHAGAVPEEAAFPEGDKEEEGGVGHADEGNVDL